MGQCFAGSPSRNMMLASYLLLVAGGALAGPYIHRHGLYGFGLPARARGLEVIGIASAQVRLESSSGVSGTLYIEQWPNLIGGLGAHVRIHGRIAGLERGLHGFHVHAVGNTSENCLAAGVHFNPDQVKHGARCGVHATDSAPFLPTVILSCDPKESHAGDLGNIATPLFGETSIDQVDTILSLGDGGERDIAGRAIVIHAGADDLGVGTGDAEEGSKIPGTLVEELLVGSLRCRGRRSNVR